MYINLSTLDNLNKVMSILLHKGHGKDPCSDRSYRTISNCTVLAKALDAYLGTINIPLWDKSQIDIQFQGKNSSHDLASLQTTELILYSNNVLKRPLYALFLDAKSCFDRVRVQNVIKNAYRTGTSDSSLNLINNRLSNRSSFIKFNNDVIGPIYDSLGVKQGGLLSDRLFRLVGNDQLLFAQLSNLGAPLHYPNHHSPEQIPKITISAIGQADDTALFSNDLFSLNLLASLSDQYANRTNTIFVPDKTKLVAFVDNKLKYIPPPRIIFEPNFFV